MDKIRSTLLLLILSSIFGCARTTLEQSRPIPAESAKYALSVMLRNMAAMDAPGSQDLFQRLGSGDYLSDLENSDSQVDEEGKVVIGDWTCDCKMLSFTATFSSRHQLFIIDGTFAKDSDGMWRASIAHVTMSHASGK